MKAGPKIPYGGKATAIFGLVLIAIFWIGTSQRSSFELAEATASEFSKNENLALALDVQTEQLLAGIDHFLLLIKDQYEGGAAPRIPLKRLVAPAFGSASSITFIGVTNQRGDVVESFHDFEPGTNVLDREFFQQHLKQDTNRLVISEPVLGRISGRWTITLTRRINNADGSFGGIAAISIEPQYLTRLFETTQLGPNDVMSLVLTNGITLARRRGDAISFGEDISQSRLLQEQTANPGGTYIGPGGVDGQLRVFAYRTMRDHPVIATVGTLERDAFAAVRSRSSTYFAVAVLLTLIVSGGCAVAIQLLARNERAHHRLREQASLLDKAQDAILVTDLERRLTFWNKSAERLYGWTSAEALGTVVTELLYSNGDAAEVQHAYDEVLSRGEWHGELQPHTRDGRRVIIESRWTLVRDAAGNARSILSINTDVTDRRQLEQQFYRAQRLESIGTLAGGIAHDLNNVLAPILMGMGLLRDRLPDDDSREILDTISTSAKRGAEMVRQVLSFARGQEGKRVEIRPDDLVGDVVRIARDTLPKNIDIITHVDPHLPAVLGDPTQCHQVLLNLCVNARDAMPNGGTLTITASTAEVAASPDPRGAELAPGKYVVFHVADTGVGIAPHVVDKIFDPFFTTKEAGKGTGLGLSTSMTIVRSHGGQIQVSSQPARGARFDVYLPAMPAPAPGSSIGHRTSAARGQGETILVVDDEEAVRKILRSTLEKAGYRVLLAVHGREALDVYRAHGAAISLVIIDMTMPVLGGVPTMRELVALNPDVRIIAASGIHDNQAPARAVGPQVKAFLAKPFTRDQLLRKVGDVVTGSAALPVTSRQTVR
ncbi:MAG TPA: ATP-binding protein [Vicinamibacterales bacterium]|nr:ATP-binding protein [Vicinamibacterales bacterium]